MYLSDLPVDVLAQILDGEASWNALTLWQTGDPRMQHKLRSGGITRMDLRFPPLKRQVTWPKCLKEFRLRSLSISSRVPLLLLHELRAELMQLHIGLKSLALDLPGGVEVFCDDARCLVADLSGDHGDGSGSDNGEYDDISSDEEGYGEERIIKRHKFSQVVAPQGSLSHLWDPHTAFPSLETLSLIRITSLSATIMFKCGLLSMVPNSVKHLKADGIPVKWSALPQGLESLLDMPILPNQDLPQVFKLLPKTLTRIDCGAWSLAEVELLHRDLPQLIDKRSPWSLREGDTCPPLIQGTVTLNCSLSERSLPLPSHIQRLILPSSFDMASVRLLPPSLTFFSASEMLADESSKLPLWPRSLTSLSLSTTLPPHYFYLLPRTLKSLAISEPTRIRRRNMSIFDEMLEPETESDLLRLGLASIGGVDAHAWNTARQELIEYGKTRRGIDSGFVTAYIAHVESGGLWGLPLSLTSMDIAARLPDADVKLILPPRIRKFTTSISSKFFNNMLFFDLLPPYITELGIACDLSCVQLAEESNPSPHFHNMAYLRHITIKQLNYTNPSLVATLFSRLPRGLHTLDFLASVPLGASALLGLPSTLHSLHLNLANGIDTPHAWLHALPRSLENLNVTGSMRTQAGSDLVNLPPGLKELKLCMARLTIDELFTLPRTIRLFIARVPANAADNQLFDTAGAENGAKSLNILNTEIWKLMQTQMRPFNRIWNERAYVESSFLAQCKEEG